MIKARPVAGDIAAGEAFLRELQPYVWRKYMDYAAIADVHSIKRQIHAHKGHGEIAVQGPQRQARPRRHPRDRVLRADPATDRRRPLSASCAAAQTVPMLGELAAHGWITARGARRADRSNTGSCARVEHAIQMVADEQTHMLPEDDAGLERIAHMLGFVDAEAFSAALPRVADTGRAPLCGTVRERAGAFAGIGNLVFTGDVDDPDTLQTLQRLGFERPSDIAAYIRGWHFGRYRATQSAEARERLTELTPALLRGVRPDTTAPTRRCCASTRFSPACRPASSCFSLLSSNPALLKLLATIMASAPRLPTIITRRPHVFDGLLDPALLAELPGREYLAERVCRRSSPATSYEEVLDRLRIFAAEQKFLIGVRLLAGAIDAARAGKAFSDLADLTIGGRARRRAARVREAAHGQVPGGRVAILGMGKLGSRELTAGSDVDLILLYDHDADADESDGAKPLPPSHYFTRLTQRLIAAVSAPTAEGVLYEVDLRLRPSGNKGPVATHIDAFEKYQRHEAWTWEHMALTRARVVAGDEELCTEVEAEVEEILALPRDAPRFQRRRGDAGLIEKEKPPRDVWDLKLARRPHRPRIHRAMCGADRRSSALGERARSTALLILSPGWRPISRSADPAGTWRCVSLYVSLTQMIRLCLTGRSTGRMCRPVLPIC